MPEIETEAEKTRSEVASYLRDLADQLESGGVITLDLGGRSVRLNPTESVTLKLEGEWGEDGTGRKESIEFELVWRPTAEEGELESPDR